MATEQAAPMAEASSRPGWAFLVESPFWYTALMVVVGGLLHYTNPLAPYAADLPFQLARHNMNRVLFIVPVVYAGFIYGPRGGFITLATVTAVMLPRAIFVSSSPADSILEVGAIFVVSCLIILWFNGQAKEKRRRQAVVATLEVARQELGSQVDMVRRNERRLAALNEVCSVVNQRLDLPDILNTIMDRVIADLDVEVTLIFLKDDRGTHLELVAHRGVAPAFAEAVAILKVGEGFNGRVASDGQPMAVKDASCDGRLSVPEVKAEGIQSQMIVPLHSKGAIIGTLCVAVRGSRRFSQDDLDLLAAIGSQVGIAIENARLYQAALASEAKHRDLFANATVPIFVHDLWGTITAANNACTSLTGYPLERLIGMNVEEIFPSHACAVLAKVQADLLRHKERIEPYDVPLKRHDDGECILSMSTRLVEENGQPRGLQHIALDVTERRRMRDTLNYYVRQVLNAQEEERKRIARELHDDTAQSMLLILQRLDALTYGQAEGQETAAVREIEDLRNVALQTLANLRRLTRDLRPQILDDLGLVAAVEWLADDLERVAGIDTKVHVKGDQSAISPEAQLLLFRIVQEALSNVRRHSGAARACITIEYLADRIGVAVADDGHGFAVPESLDRLTGAGKLGLLGMAERARLLNGSLAIQSKIDEGTRVVVEVDTQYTIPAEAG